MKRFALFFSLLFTAHCAIAQMGVTSVTIAGDLQQSQGCANNWDPSCSNTLLSYDRYSDIWKGAFSIPAGSYNYKAALDGNWNVSYGLNTGGNNIPLSLPAQATVSFYYDNKSHWITDNHNSVIATVPGDYQITIGCSGNWDPACFRSWMEDPGGTGTYSFTANIPQGTYQCKVAINGSWSENYGQNGTPGGDNIPFRVLSTSANVTFSYNPATHLLSIIGASPAHDSNVEWDGLRHDSRDTLYRSPGGAVPVNTPVKLRFRTYHDDVTDVTLRWYDLNAGAENVIPMQIVAAGVPCYQSGLGDNTCDFWETTVNSKTPNNFWYRFIISDGTANAYYEDNTPALDGGLGAASADAIDNSYALMYYDPKFTSAPWAKNAVIYQIFPDRFRNGNRQNDPKTGDIRYEDPVIAQQWGALPEGYCHLYSDATSNCPWRFNTPMNTGTIEQPRGRDYFGGDLNGIEQSFDYLEWLGVNTIYFNPIFSSSSNHGYDTRDYSKINPYFGTSKEWARLVDRASDENIRIILDGVFNHLSSDSPFFDRYRQFAVSGACEDATSPLRPWFTFRPPGPGEPSPCVPSTPGGSDTFYNGWAGFDSLPVITKSLPSVQSYFLTDHNSISRSWLKQGASGWRLDVMGDGSFPNGYWETFRKVVKSTKPDALIIGELWQKDSTLLRFLRGDRADATMNYRLRDAVIGFLAPQTFDPKGFADSGRKLKPSEFLSRLQSIREDYADAAYFSMMNLLDSHDTARLLWVLTPGADNRNDKEFNPANLAEGKRRQQIAATIQFSVPGAPTIYYGDEAGVTGNDDPDDRRTFPWPDVGGAPDFQMGFFYHELIEARKHETVLRHGDFRGLLADDSNDAVAFGRKTEHQAAVLIVNRSQNVQIVNVPVAGYLRDNLTFQSIFTVQNPDSMAITSGGVLQATLGPESAILFATGQVNLKPPDAPTNLAVQKELSNQVSLSWTGTPHAASYNVYASPVSGGGYTRANTSLVTRTTFTATGLTNAQTYYFVVTTIDADGNESLYSNEVNAIPHLVIGWANLQWPPSITETISSVNRTPSIYGQVWIDGVTNQPGAAPGLMAQVGFGPTGSNPAGNSAWTWVDSTFNTNVGNNDEFVGNLLPTTVGSYDYLYRYSTTHGRDWLYADLNGPVSGLPPNPGKLTVNPGPNVNPPSAPQNLQVTGASPKTVSLLWSAVTGDPNLYGYEVLRGSQAGGPYSIIATTTATTYTDSNVLSGTTYFYVVRAIDLYYNRSGPSNEVNATAKQRKVAITFNVTVPTSTNATVHIAGTLNLLDGNLPMWDPGATQLTKVDSTHWTITLTGNEGVQLQYKYTLGSWNYVEKGSACDEIANRMITLTYGDNGVQTESDIVPNWRNVSPCGN